MGEQVTKDGADWNTLGVCGVFSNMAGNVLVMTILMMSENKL